MNKTKNHKTLRTAKNRRKPVGLYISADFLSDRIPARALRSVCQIGVNDGRLYDDLTVTDKMLNRFRKLVRNSLPKNQGVIVMEDSPLARRLGDGAHKLGKAYVIPSVDEFFDLLFHQTNPRDKALPRCAHNRKSFHRPKVP